MKTNGLGKESVLCSYCLFGIFEFFLGVAGYYLKHLRYLTLRLCLVPGKYKGKKKNAKENDFFMFGCPMKNIKENQI